MRDIYVKNNFFQVLKNDGDSIVRKEATNHRKYMRGSLKWCIENGKKKLFLNRLLGLYDTSYFFHG